MGGEGVKDLGVALGPSVVDGDAFQAPFLAVAGQLAIVAVHEESVLGPAARTLARHEVLRHDVCGKRRGIVADLDLEVGGGVARIERADEGRTESRMAWRPVISGKSRWSFLSAGRKSKMQSSVSAEASESASP